MPSRSFVLKPSFAGTAWGHGVGAGVHPIPDGSLRLHDVQQGDQLRKLAQHYYGDPNKSKLIAAANLDKVIDPNRIYVGMRLRIPDIDEA